jgi:hypothetical protein
MQLPTVERNPHLRPAGADQVTPVAARVIPVAPVNPSQTVQEPAGVVNDIHPELQANAAAKAGDPLQGGAKADQSGADWTQRFHAGKPEEPPQEPLSKMLMEHVHSLWMASARAIELLMMNNPQQSQDPNKLQQLAQNRAQDPAAAPGLLTREVLTYSPSKIRKTEKPQ